MATQSAGIAKDNRSGDSPVDLLEQMKQFATDSHSANLIDRLHQFFELAWQYTMAENPEWATANGFPGYDDRWPDYSVDGWNRRRLAAGLQLNTLHAIDRTMLSPDDQISYDLFERNVMIDAEELSYPTELLLLTQMDGPHQNIPRMLAMMPAENADQREAILRRLEAVPTYLAQTQQLLTEGLDKKITHPRVAVGEIAQQVRNQIVDDPRQSPMLAALLRARRRDESADVLGAIEEAVAIYRTRIVPALTTFAAFLNDRYLPVCRMTTAWTDLPNGRDWYTFLVRRHITTDLTPDRVFEIGMSEVKRIRAEMQKVIDGAGFTGDFTAWCEFLRTDPRFYCNSAEELLMTYRDISKRVDPELARLFGTLPRLPYGVTPIPSYAEKSQTTAYYEPGSPAAGRPGYFYANTYDLKSRPKWEMEALTLHEAVPGHHLQIALMQEISNIPEFRKYMWITAYGEGWALYSERLGKNMGFYTDPYSKFGQLTYEMWRAIRLVVDPGLHWKGWSREKAVDFFLANSSKPRHDVEVEIDRYIVWPGQALAYKIGELKITEIRGRAEKTLGDRFDIRAFHDELLGAGCLPLDLLERRMDAWLQRQQTAK